MTRHTWWGQRFIAALESFTDNARLARGRGYANSGRVLSLDIDAGGAKAQVQGSINPYFGVYREPCYTTEVALKPLSQAQWRRAITETGNRAGLVTRLLLGELPESMEAIFGQLGLPLLPQGPGDFVSRCSCPDYSNPCKHVAAIYYLLADRLDTDPLLLFELRGLSRDRLREELSATPLGKVLADALTREASSTPRVLDSYHTRPSREAPATNLDYGSFWGENQEPPGIAAPEDPPLPALLVRKGGERPAFWNGSEPFVEVMTEFYQRIRKLNKDAL